MNNNTIIRVESTDLVESEKVCIFCLGNLKSDIHTTSCNHKFCASCFREFIRFNQSCGIIEHKCPLCRKQLVNVVYGNDLQYTIPLQGVSIDVEQHPVNNTRQIENIITIDYLDNILESIKKIFYALYIIFLLSQLIIGLGIAIPFIKTKYTTVMILFSICLIANSSILISIFTFFVIKLYCYKENIVINIILHILIWSFRAGTSLAGVTLWFNMEENTTNINIYILICHLFTIIDSFIYLLILAMLPGSIFVA